MYLHKFRCVYKKCLAGKQAFNSHEYLKEFIFYFKENTFEEITAKIIFVAVSYSTYKNI